MVKDLQLDKSGKSVVETSVLSRRLISSFENCMNNDLDVKTAFDSLYEIISELQKNVNH